MRVLNSFSSTSVERHTDTATPTITTASLRPKRSRPPHLHPDKNICRMEVDLVFRTKDPDVTKVGGRFLRARGADSLAVTNLNSKRKLEDFSRNTGLDDVLLTCAACEEDFPKRLMSKSECGHVYHRHCLQKLFSDAINNEADHPARCCKIEIPVRGNRMLLSPAIQTAYELAFREYATPANRRTYCATPSCGRFMPEGSNLRRTKACHVGQCMNEHDDQQLLQLANVEGWARCPYCGRLIERTEGCPDMRCNCGNHFDFNEHHVKPQQTKKAGKGNKGKGPKK
ncbi:MAG: hypothetical protein M1828_005336 [Chrysothrix sp. TS-e1954]|nr:MAG: hypothetical protein M1828_005336 [Chrysothrix sp. TS-e1954]